jgi:hypothetical protein
MNFFDLLLASRLPIPPSGTIAAWTILYAVNHVVARKLRESNVGLAWYKVEDRATLERSSRPSWMFVQILYAASVFAFSGYAGGPLFVLLAGGLAVTMVVVLGMNAQSLLSSRAMHRVGAVKGEAWLSTAMVYRHSAARCAGAALACALLGLLLAHLAPLGGALMCGAAACGYVRRARNAP